MSDDEKFMEMALDEARAALADGNKPFGCVIVRDGAVIGRGHTRWQSEHDPTAHAEIEAIRSTCRALRLDTLKGMTLYTTGEPCMMCVGAIVYAELGRVVASSVWEDRPEGFITTFDDSVVRAPQDAPYPYEYATGVLREQSAELLKSFMEKYARR